MVMSLATDRIAFLNVVSLIGADGGGGEYDECGDAVRGLEMFRIVYDWE